MCILSGTIALVMMTELPSRLLTITDFSRMTLEKSQTGVSLTLTSAPIEPGILWDEMVPSWNVREGDGLVASLEVRVIEPDFASRYFGFGSWTPVPQLFGASTGARTSLDGQANDFGKIATDTLILSKPARQLELRIRLEPGVTDEIIEPSQLLAKLNSLHLSFRNSTIVPKEREPLRSAWGQIIEVPRKSQMSYENGNVICSPTATSMVLCHWAAVQARPEWKIEVPEVVKAVYDPAYKGTGNWSFNASFAGSLNGMTGFVAHLADIHDLELLTQAGFPVVCSVRYALLKGKDVEPEDDGHLVVLVGFNAEGDPVFNDPGRSTEIRQTYRREHFLRAWTRPGRAVYLIYPQGLARPKLSMDSP